MFPINPQKIVGISNNLDYSHRSLSANIFLINLYELMQMTKDGSELIECTPLVFTLKWSLYLVYSLPKCLQICFVRVSVYSRRRSQTSTIALIWFEK